MQRLTTRLLATASCALALSACGTVTPAMLLSEAPEQILTREGPPHPRTPRDTSAAAVQWALDSHQDAMLVVSVCLQDSGEIRLRATTCR
jgi:hypothetical protein